MGGFNKVLKAITPKMITNPIAGAIGIAVAAGVSFSKQQKPKKATKGKRKAVSPKEKAISRKQKKISKKQKKIIQRVCQSAYGIFIRGATTVGAKYVGHPAVAIPASEMIKTMMEENASTVNYLVQLETKPKEKSKIAEKKESSVMQYLQKGVDCVKGYHDSYLKALNGEQVIDEKYTLENLFSGNLTLEDIPDFQEYINMLAATRGALQRGAWNSVTGTFDAVKMLVTEPGQVWETISSGVSDFVEHPWESTKEFVGETVDGFVDAVWRSTPQEMAEDVGEIAADVAVDALTAGTGAAATIGLKTGVKKVTTATGKKVTKTITKTLGVKNLKELLPDAKVIKKWGQKELSTNKGWMKNLVTAGGDINGIAKNHYNLILPDGNHSNAINLAKKNSAANGSGVNIRGKIPETNAKKGKTIEVEDKVIKNATGDTKHVVNSNFKDLMSFKESIRYNEYWLDVAEKISDEALKKHILFINRGGIKKPNGKPFKPVKVSVALDLNTGNMYFGYNGSNPKVFNPSRTEIVPELQKRIKRTKKLAANKVDNYYASRMSFKKWSVDNCAEVYAVNNLLRDGGEFNNIFINTKNSLEKQADKYLLTAPPCKNCKETFKKCFFPKK